VIIRNDNGFSVSGQSGSRILNSGSKAQQNLHTLPHRKKFVHIEAFHSIVQRELIERYEFSSFYEANQHIESYMQCIIMKGSIESSRITPHQKWKQGLPGSN